MADYIDPPRIIPLVGPAQFHHAHYKCIVYFTEVTHVGWPVPYTTTTRTARKWSTSTTTTCTWSATSIRARAPAIRILCRGDSEAVGCRPNGCRLDTCVPKAPNPEPSSLSLQPEALQIEPRGISACRDRNSLRTGGLRRIAWSRRLRSRRRIPALGEQARIGSGRQPVPPCRPPTRSPPPDAARPIAKSSPPATSGGCSATAAR